MAKNGSFRFLLLKLILADKVVDQLADLPLPQYRHLVAKSGTNLVADLPPSQIDASSGQEW